MLIGLSTKCTINQPIKHPYFLPKIGLSFLCKTPSIIAI